MPPDIQIHKIQTILPTMNIYKPQITFVIIH